MWQDELIAAIEGRRLVLLDYGGQQRRCQPHVLAIHGDNLILEAYQDLSVASAKSDSHWRHFNVDEISSLELLAATFKPRKDFNPRKSRWDQVIATV
jgi:predicted DNA-binding transcriptional regulator YafY